MTVLGKMRKSLLQQIAEWEASKASAESRVTELSAQLNSAQNRVVELTNNLQEAAVELQTLKDRIDARGGAE